MAGRKGRGHRSQKVQQFLYRVEIPTHRTVRVRAFKAGHAAKLAREMLNTTIREARVTRIG